MSPTAFAYSYEMVEFDAATLQSVSRAAVYSYESATFNPATLQSVPGGVAYSTEAVVYDSAKLVGSARGIAYSYKGDDERALADYDLCLQLRPTFGSAYNNRGLIFMRRGELQRALDEFNLAVKHVGNDQSRYLHHYNRGRLQGLMKRYDASLAPWMPMRS